MKTFRLQAHSQPITKVRFNRDGDLLFVSCKDKLVSVWYTSNGEILGSYKAPHAIVDIGISFDSKYLGVVTAGGVILIFDVQTGKVLCERDVSKYRVTSVQFHPTEHKFLLTIPYTRDEPTTELHLYQVFVSQNQQTMIQLDSRLILTDQRSSIFVACYGPMGKSVLIGCRDGSVKLYDVDMMIKAIKVTDALVCEKNAHEQEIKDIVLSNDGVFFLTGSADQTARLLHSETLEILKTYKTDEPVNTVAISPLKNHIIVGGGTRAQEVTTSYRKRETFDTIFHHLIYEKEVGVVKGHFGPINSIRFSPNGKMFASGGEDSITKLYKFHSTYLDAKDDSKTYLKGYVV